VPLGGAPVGLTEQRGWADGEIQEEARAPARPGIKPNSAVHASDELTADVEAEARSAHAAGEVRVEAVELREDPFMLGGRNPEPFVVHAEPHPIAECLDPHFDRPAVRPST
jgi:hypothetical protein